MQLNTITTSDKFTKQLLKEQIDIELYTAYRVVSK